MIWVSFISWSCSTRLGAWREGISRTEGAWGDFESRTFVELEPGKWLEDKNEAIEEFTNDRASSNVNSPSRRSTIVWTTLLLLIFFYLAATVLLLLSFTIKLYYFICKGEIMRTEEGLSKVAWPTRVKSVPLIVIRVELQVATVLLNLVFAAMPPTKQAPTRQAITLKGSTKLVTEFFKYAANTFVQSRFFLARSHIINYAQDTFPAWRVPIWRFPDG